MSFFGKRSLSMVALRNSALIKLIWEHERQNEEAGLASDRVDTCKFSYSISGHCQTR